MPGEGFRSFATLAACCILSLGLHLFLVGEYGGGSRFGRAGLPVAPGASWQLPPAAEVTVSLQAPPAARRSDMGAAAIAAAAPTSLLLEAGTILVTDLAPLPGVPGLEAENALGEAPLAPLPTLLPQTDSQAERERVLGFDPRGFAFGNPASLLPAPVVPMPISQAPAAPAAQTARAASAFPVGPSLGALPPPPNFGLNPPSPPPGTSQTSAPPDGDGPPEQAASPARAPGANPAPAGSVFPIMPVVPVAATPPPATPPAGTPPTTPVAPENPASSFPAQQPGGAPDKAPAAMPAPVPPPAAPVEPDPDGKTPAADPKTTSAKPDAVPGETGKAGENKTAAPNEKGTPAPATKGTTPLPTDSPDPKAGTEKNGKTAPVVPIAVPLARAAPAADDKTSANGGVRYRGAFRAPRDGNYRLRLSHARSAKTLVDGAPAKAGTAGSSLRLTAGRHRVEVQVSREASKTDSAPPVLEITPADE